MPVYDYRCLECRKRFTLVHTMAEHGRKRSKCPKCSSLRVERVLGSVLVKTRKKS